MQGRREGETSSEWSWLRRIAAREPLTSRTSTAERVADALRTGITEGHLHPGSRLSEELLSGVLGVSRNTLREAFRLLTHEGLLVHRLHHGVVVPQLDEDAVVDLYRLRIIVEVQVLRSLTEVDPAGLRRLQADIEAAEKAAGLGEWTDVGTANIHFHQHLARLANSARLEEVARRVLAELRLAFHVAGEKELYESFLPRNRELVALLEAGDTQTAATELERYLIDSRAHLLSAYRDRRGATRGLQNC
jgi:DNA-binding GntR family transcriptional regulator